MKVCKLCKKKVKRGNGTFFAVPKDKERRKKWSEICGEHFLPSSLVCCDHFSRNNIITAGQRTLLMPNAVPDMELQNRTNLSLASTDSSILETTDNTESTDELDMNIYLVNKNQGGSVKEDWRIFKDQSTQTEPVIFAAEMDKYKEIIRNLKNEVKDLKLEVSKTELAMKGLEKIFTDGQIKKLKSPGRIDWSWTDISEAICLYAAGARAYKYLYKKGFPLPHVTTLQRWCKEGIYLTYISDEDKICVLSSDEMNEYNLLDEVEKKAANYVQVNMDVNQPNTMSLSDISIKFTEATCEDIIKKAGGTKYTSFKFGKGFKKGDSYLSKVFRLCVYGVNEKTGKNLEVNLICKGMPDNMARRKVFRSADFFRNEINFYLKVIPAWEKFQSKRKPKNPFNEYPICYASHCDGEHDFIALQDVSFLGYGAPDRQEYISLDECLLTMRTLGRFHGISLALNALEPDVFEKTAKCLEETYYAESNRKWYIDFLKLACGVAKDAVTKTLPNSKYESLADNFLQEALYDDMINLVSTRSKLSVFGHGDCWTPNFLTRYSTEGKAEAIKIIDFQLARCASLALDISFFIYSCTSQELRESHYEYLLKAYHESACDLIKDLGADPDKVMSWQTLQNELKQFARFGCGMGIESLPMSLLEEDEIADLDEITANSVLTDVWNLKPFKEPKKCQRIAEMFKHAIDQGYIQ